MRTYTADEVDEMIGRALAREREQRKPLTDEEIAHATAPVFMGGTPSLTGIARAIEAAHGIKSNCPLCVTAKQQQEKTAK